MNINLIQSLQGILETGLGSGELNTKNIVISIEYKIYWTPSD